MNKFWNFTDNDGDECELRLEGEIASESWWGDEVTPALFKAELARHPGDVTVWINSPGGDVFAASVIYTALMEHKGHVTVKIDGVAASAASVIAMAGESVYMSPTSYMMIHDPWTIAMGNSEEMRKTADILDSIADGIMNAYEIKTGKTRDELKALMGDETWMDAKGAVELGFADAILYVEDIPGQTTTVAACGGKLGVVYARARSIDNFKRRVEAAQLPGKPDDNADEERRKAELRFKLMLEANK